MEDGEPRLMRCDEQIKLVTDLRVALRRASERKLDWFCEQIREALYAANVGLEPENLGQIRPLMMALLERGMSEQDRPSKEEKQVTPDQTVEGKPPSLQDLRRRIYAKAKAEPAHRFWGLYVHIAKEETIRAAYKMAKENDGAPGIDGVTFQAIEENGLEKFLDGIRAELVSRTYLPMRNRRKEIPKGNGKTRVLGIPSIRDRVVQGALKLILEPIFEADFQPGSFGYRPNRSQHQAIDVVAGAIASGKTRVIDLDLKAYFDNVRHHILLEKVAKRVEDPEVLHLLKMVLKASGKKGVPQGGVISPLLSNIYLNEVDVLLEEVKKATQLGPHTNVEYARYADDLVVLVNWHPRQDGVVESIDRRLKEELNKIQVQVNEEKTRIVDLMKGESFDFLGFRWQRIVGNSGKGKPLFTPLPKKRKELTEKITQICRQLRSQPAVRLIERLNPVLRGWVHYFRVGNSSNCFSYIRHWVNLKVRRHLMRARKRKGFGWNRWSNEWIQRALGLFDDYHLKHLWRK